METSDLRQRLTAFYERYAPDDMTKVERALQLTVPESQLFGVLYAKYNVPLAEQTFTSHAPVFPHHLHASGDGNGAATAKKLRIIAFYRRYAPDSMHNVAGALQSSLSEERLLAKLCADCNVPSEVAVSAADLDSDTVDLRQRLTAFYERYTPDDMTKVERALQLTVPESQLFGVLYAKYNVPLAEQTFTSHAPVLP